jgi:hypothetical protein
MFPISCLGKFSFVMQAISLWLIIPIKPSNSAPVFYEAGHDAELLVIVQSDVISYLSINALDNLYVTDCIISNVLGA